MILLSIWQPHCSSVLSAFWLQTKKNAEETAEKPFESSKRDLTYEWNLKEFGCCSLENRKKIGTE